MNVKVKKIVCLLLTIMMIGTAFLGVTAFADEEAAKPQRDIYLLLDISGSMKGKHMTRLKDDSKDFVKAIMNDETGNNRICIITFADEATVYDWSTDYDEMAAIIDGLEAGGDSNMVAALRAVKDKTAATPDSAKCKRVVIMGDGLPNKGGEIAKGKYTFTDSPCYFKYGNALYVEATGMWDDYVICTVGITHCCGGIKYKFRKQLMKDIANRLYQEEYVRDPLVAAVLAPCDPKPAPTEPASEPEVLPTQAPTCPPTEAPTEPPTQAPTVPSTKCKCPNCNCVDCKCGENCSCGTTCPCPTTCICAPTTCAPTTNPPKNVPQTGDTKAIIAVAAISLLAGVGIVATRKREQ